MDRTLIAQHLAEAERHVAQGYTHIERQSQVVTDLSHGDDPELAKSAAELLKQFEDMQILHVVNRDRLRRELAENQHPSGFGFG